MNSRGTTECENAGLWHPRFSFGKCIVLEGAVGFKTAQCGRQLGTGLDVVRPHS